MSKSKKFLDEFKEFISKGSVIDLAVGIIIGTAFTAIVTSLVNDVIMPLVGFIIGGVDFTTLKWILVEGSEGIEEVAINYGMFIQSIINFLIIAFVIFTMIKAINRFKRKQEAKEEEIPEEIELLREIRDSLKNNNI